MQQVHLQHFLTQLFYFHFKILFQVALFHEQFKRVVHLAGKKVHLCLLEFFTGDYYCSYRFRVGCL